MQPARQATVKLVRLDLCKAAAVKDKKGARTLMPFIIKVGSCRRWRVKRNVAAQCGASLVSFGKSCYEPHGHKEKACAESGSASKQVKQRLPNTSCNVPQRNLPCFKILLVERMSCPC